MSRQQRTIKAIKTALKKTKKYKKGEYPSSDRYRKEKEWRDGWFENEK